MSQVAVQTQYRAFKNHDVEFQRALFTPVKDTAESYNYGVTVDLESFFAAGAAQKHYGFTVSGDHLYAITGDSNSAYIRITGSNYGACDANYILRGLNVGLTNRSGGTMGILENLISIQNKSGGTVPTMRALNVVNENYGTNATESGIADFINRNEANTATLSYGIRIRNDDRSSQGAVQSAINIDSHASSGGFRELIDASAAELTEYDSGTQVVLMKFQGANGTTYYLVHDTDSATVLAVATSVS